MIIGISGAIGSGKSHAQIKAALFYAERREKQLVFNFRVNRQALLQYARKNEMKWVESLLFKGGISEIYAPKNVQSLLLPGSVVCLDEAGVFLNSRAFKDTPKELLADLAQSRKGDKKTRGGVDLIWAAQFNDQVDKQLRQLTQYWLHCDGVERYSKQHKEPRLLWKSVYWFKAWDYQQWINDLRARTSFLKTKFSFAFQHESGPLSKNDRLAFEIFSSMSRLDSGFSDRIFTADCCQRDDLALRREYYDSLPRRYIMSEPNPCPSVPSPIPKAKLGGEKGANVIPFPSAS